MGFGGTILKTSNGGTAWSTQTSGTTEWLSSVHFTDAQTGWAVGEYGTILKTSNGGSTWSPQNSGTTNWLFSVHFTDAQTGWAVGGEITDSSGIILKTSNGGSAWSTQTSGTHGGELRSVHFSDAQTGWAVGLDWDGTGSYGTILKTSNGGSTWGPQTSGTTSWLYSVHFTDAQTGWVVGYDNQQGTGTILKTTTGGNPVSIRSLVSVPAFSMYPNPAAESIYLKTESSILQTSLIDALGKEQAAFPDHENRLDIRHLKPGLYWLKVQTKDGVSVQKVVKR